MTNGPVAAEELRLLLERIERLEEEKKGIADDIKDVYAEAKGRGFDTRTMREIIKLRKMDTNARREREALLDTYKAALGMLDGTPLGNWAVKRLQGQPKPDGGEGAEPGAEPGEGPDGEMEANPSDPLGGLDDAAAREMGRSAAREGKPVTANPFPARDPRRAAWDEAWCGELGTDGMDIPEALRPAQKPKKPKSEGGDNDGEGGDE